MFCPKLSEYPLSNYSQVLTFCQRYAEVPVLGSVVQIILVRFLAVTGMTANVCVYDVVLLKLLKSPPKAHGIITKCCGQLLNSF